MLVNTLVGLREVPHLHDRMRSMKATPAQTLRYLELPASSSCFLGRLTLPAPHFPSLVPLLANWSARIVGWDFINVGGQYDTALVFVAVITLMVLASSLYGLILLLESRLLSWQTLAAESLKNTLEHSKCETFLPLLLLLSLILQPARLNQANLTWSYRNHPQPDLHSQCSVCALLRGY